MATIYACSDDMNSCGSIWWSRPGVLRALCRFEGLVKFPEDLLSCEMEISTWGADGRYHDINFYHDGSTALDGISYKNDGSGSLAGITSGSNFQDYKPHNATS